MKKHIFLASLFFAGMAHAGSVVMTDTITGYYYMGGFPGNPMVIACQGNPCVADSSYTAHPIPGVSYPTYADIRASFQQITDPRTEGFSRNFSPNTVFYYGDFQTHQSNYVVEDKNSNFAPDVIGSGTFTLGPGTWDVQYGVRSQTAPNAPNNYFSLSRPGSGVMSADVEAMVPGGTVLNWNAESEVFGAQDNWTNFYAAFTDLSDADAPEPTSFGLVLGAGLIGFLSLRRNKQGLTHSLK